MKTPGGGSLKGSNFEREIGYMLSKWISNGSSDDLICRAGGSGASFTTYKRGTAGDLKALDGRAQPFFDRYVIECKHWQDLDYYLHSFLLGEKDLYEAMLKVKTQAASQGKSFMLIVKQNRRPELIITPLHFSCDPHWVKLIFPTFPVLIITELKKYLAQVTYEQAVKIEGP